MGIITIQTIKYLETFQKDKVVNWLAVRKLIDNPDPYIYIVNSRATHLSIGKGSIVRHLFSCQCLANFWHKMLNNVFTQYSQCL